MVKVDIAPEEAQAYAELMKDAKCPPEMGYLLTSLKFKIFEAFKKAKSEEAKKVARDMLEQEKKNKKEKTKGKE